MINKLFKKTIAFSLAAIMTVGMTGVVSARVADGTNIVNGTWTSFSVCTREDGGVWEDALKALPQVKGEDYATEGRIKTQTSSSFNFAVINTGWDAEYVEGVDEPVADNPWGMTATMENLSVEAGRNYTLSFKIKSTLKAKTEVEGVYQTVKHILFKAYQPGNGDPSYDLVSPVNISSDGYIKLDSANEDYMEVKAKIAVPSDYRDGKLGLKFAMGALMKSFKEEVALSGWVYVKDFKITADKQYLVKYVSQGKTVKTTYVNDGSAAPKFAAKRKGYTLAGYTFNGKAYTFGSRVTSNMTLTAKWVKTKKPAKAKIAGVKSNSAKKAVVTVKKMKNVKGYAVQYSTKANFKGAKQVTSKKTKITLKKLKSGSIVYVRVKAYVLDSASNKVLGKKWSAKKLVVVK